MSPRQKHPKRQDITKYIGIENAYVYAYTHTHTHTYIHTRTRAYIHRQTQR